MMHINDITLDVGFCPQHSRKKHAFHSQILANLLRCNSFLSYFLLRGHKLSKCLPFLSRPFRRHCIATCKGDCNDSACRPQVACLTGAVYVELCLVPDLICWKMCQTCSRSHNSVMFWNVIIQILFFLLPHKDEGNGKNSIYNRQKF